MKKPQRTINGKEAAADIVAGMTDPQLMAKYDLNERQLEYLMQQLLQRKLVSEQQLNARLAMAETQVTKAFVEVNESIRELDSDDSTSWHVTTMYAVLRDAESSPAPQTPPAKPSAKRKPKPTPKVKASQVVADLRSGHTDTRIMRKYSLAPPQLEFIFQKLLDAGHVTVEELYNRTSLSGTSITKAFMDVYDYMKELDGPR